MKRLRKKFNSNEKICEQAVKTVNNYALKNCNEHIDYEYIKISMRRSHALLLFTRDENFWDLLH